MIDTLANLDTGLFLYLNNLGSEKFDTFCLYVTNKWTSIPLYVLALFLVYRKHGIKGALIIMGVEALLITTTYQLSYLFMDNCQRPRPCQVVSFQNILRI